MIPTTIEGKQRVMLKALRTLGADKWHDRNDLAKHFAKNRLNPVEVVALDLLEADGLVEKRMAQSRQPNVMRWEYRIKGGEVIEK